MLLFFADGLRPHWKQLGKQQRSLVLMSAKGDAKTDIFHWIDLEHILRLLLITKSKDMDT